LPTWPEGSDANPEHEDKNKIEAASMTLSRIRDRIPGLFLRDGFVGQENGFVAGAVPMFVGSHRRPFVEPQLCIFAAIMEAPAAARVGA
jgi:hypothetical protein